MPGSASAPAPGRQPYTGPGGIGVRVNDAPAGVRSDINLVSTPGVSWVATDDPGNARVNVSARVAGEVLLGSATGIDLLTGTELALLISALAVQRVSVTRIVVLAEDVTVVTIQPTVEAGTDAPGNPPNNDMAVSQALALTATDQMQELTLLDPRPTLDQSAPNDVLRLRQTAAATATTYTVGVQVYGVVLVP